VLYLTAKLGIILETTKKNWKKVSLGAGRPRDRGKS
jgi:hypothetical protein